MVVVSPYSNAQIERPWELANKTGSDPEEEKIIKEAYQSLMTITLKKSNDDSYTTFSENVKARAKKEFSNFTYNEDEVC